MFLKTADVALSLPADRCLVSLPHSTTQHFSANFPNAPRTPGTKSELDYWTVPQTQVAVRRTFWGETHLMNPITNEGPYSFRLPKDIYYLNLAKNYLYMKLRIVRADGSPLQHFDPLDGTGSADNVGPINLLGKTFIRQLKVSLNGRLISGSGDRYAYRTMIETDLNHNWDCKNSQREANLFESDTPGKIDTDQNEGWRTRSNRFKYSQYVESMAPLHCDLFNQERFLLNQCELIIDIYRNRNTDQFLLMCFEANAQRYKVEIQQMIWYVKEVELADSVSLAIERMLTTTTAKYPIRRTQITTMSITENRRTTPLNSLFAGVLPRRLVICMVHADAAQGTMTRSPFNFEHFNISDIRITNGSMTVPSAPYRMNFDHGSYIRPFVQMFEGLNIAGENTGNEIGLNAFVNGSRYFVFELSADGSDGPYWQLQSEGSTSLEMTFDQAE